MTSIARTICAPLVMSCMSTPDSSRMREITASRSTLTFWATSIAHDRAHDARCKSGWLSSRAFFRIELYDTVVG